MLSMNIEHVRTTLSLVSLSLDQQLTFCYGIYVGQRSTTIYANIAST